ncbi:MULTISPECIES: hypothetical protein [unclassified Caballeronia]|uniref:hypothetical protein n=1 Tax=unclassified Caballeronia TaxID=2646786 RepID=UPI001F3B19A9|nr:MULTISPECIES: hypothetical protein [unclassified Caballeronia]MCE4547741.1 hypothetical protein [Caballeronia sp. PC1]MCE4575197.1 hypothetical protein [Caballeronia sp. CLC5]
MTYTIDPLSIEFTETRRGVNATAKILREGQRIGTINDFAERIVTDVFFNTEQERAAFAAEARRNLVSVFGEADHSDSAYVSEYARQLLEQAEQLLLAQSQDDQVLDADQ